MLGEDEFSDDTEDNFFDSEEVSSNDDEDICGELHIL